MAVGHGRARTYARRRRRRVAAADNDLTPAQWALLKYAWGGCAYCGAMGTPLQKDCIQPIAHGGRYTVTNVVPACKSCNASKWDLEVTTWLRHKQFNEEAFLTRYLQISAEISTMVNAKPSAATSDIDSEIDKVA